MNCKKVKNLMLDYLDNSLKNEEKREFEKHINSCEDCRREFNEISFVVEKAKEIKVPVFDENYWEKQKEKIVRGAIKYRRKFYLKPVIVFASLIIIAFAFYIKFHSGEKIETKLAKTSGYTVFYSTLPFSEEELLQMVDYISEKDAESLLNIILQ